MNYVLNESLEQCNKIIAAVASTKLVASLAALG